MGIDRYSRSQNNANVVYCNYIEITSSYSVTTERNLPHTMHNEGIRLKIFVWNFKKHVIFKIVSYQTNKDI